jgi:hypothetical protein
MVSILPSSKGTPFTTLIGYYRSFSWFRGERRQTEAIHEICVEAFRTGAGVRDSAHEFVDSSFDTSSKAGDALPSA